MPADKFGRCSYVGTCLNVWPTWWGVSCHPDGDGCMVETYLEFKLCPSHWSPLAPWLTLPQGSHPKNKGTAPGYMLSQLIISLFVCVDGKKNNAKADRQAHKASSNFSYNRRMCLLLWRLWDYLLALFESNRSLYQHSAPSSSWVLWLKAHFYSYGRSYQEHSHSWALHISI